MRRLDRDGDGEYRIGGAKCRLIDVLEVLSDTGLGKEMHSVISQGRVEAIVTSKPRDRRLLIEEAAGLGKHRKRRRRAQLKLGHTQDNLDRALDVEREARSRLKPLKRQAEAAELTSASTARRSRFAGSSHVMRCEPDGQSSPPRPSRLRTPVPSVTRSSSSWRVSERAVVRPRRLWRPVRASVKSFHDAAMARSPQQIASATGLTLCARRGGR